MDKNTVIGLLLIFALFIAFTIYNQPSDEEIQRRQQVQDSLEMVKWRKDSIERLRSEALKEQKDTRQENIRQEETTPGQSADIADTSFLRDKYGAFAVSAAGEDQTYIVENELMKLWISARGGKIFNVQLKKYQTYDSLPLILFNNNDSKFGFTFFANNRIINTNNLYFEPRWPAGAARADSMYVSEGDSLTFVMRLNTNAASNNGAPAYMEYVYTIYGDSYMMDYDLNMIGMNKVIDLGTSYLDLSWEADMRRQERSLDNERNEATIYYKYFEDEVDYLSERKDDEESLVTPVRWLSFKTRFFLSTLIADRSFTNADISVMTDEQNTREHYLKSMKALIGVPFDNSPRQNFEMQFYFGPNKYSTLNKFDLELERQIPLGWSFFLLAWINIYAVIPVFDWLGGYGWNYGIVILILTIMLKIVLFPIAYKTYKSSAKMRVLKPEIDELSKKYPKREDAMKKQQATMSLYKKAGVNPMAGCVPMLLQFPILIAMFRFFPSSIELRQESFLWANDLSSYDSILSLPFNIPFYGDHVSLFTLLMTASTILYTKINNEMMGSTSNQMPGMKTMMYIMPIMFLGIFNNFASGLSYYYLLANLITFAQMFLIRKTIDEKKILKQIQMNKKKPVKKSKFQKRLEDMAKQRGVNPQTGKKSRR